jgi:hypothetical protein
MELTAQILREWFGQFNALYFGNELPEPRFIVNKARHLLGQFSCKKVRQGLFRGYKTIGYTIKVSEYYDLSAHEYQSTLLHEMIHFYITYARARDTSAHGKIFRQWMQRLNKDGWDITISSKTDRYAIRQQPTDVQYLLLALKTKDDKYFLSVVNPSYRKYIERQLTLSSVITAHHWFISNDAKYAKWSKVRSLRGKRITKFEYESFLTQIKAK